MTLPALDIPFTLALPFEIPLLMHPIAVHFAVALPVIILLLELSNLMFKSSIEIENIEFKRRAMSVTSLLLTLLLVAIYFVAFFTGKVDGSEAGPLLSSAGQEELKTHKLIGTYLVYASIILVAMKAFSMLVARGWAKILFLLLLLAFIAGSLKQGKDGGELIYEHGANVKVVSAHEDTIDDLNDELEEAEEEEEKDAQKIKELQEKLDASKAVSGATLEAVEEVKQSVQTEVAVKVAEEPIVVEALETAVVNEEVSETVEIVEVEVEAAAAEVALPGTELKQSASEAVVDTAAEVNATH